MLRVAAAETGNCIQLIPPYFIHVQKTNNEISKQVALGYLGTEGRTLMWAFINVHQEGNGHVTASGRVSTGEKLPCKGSTNILHVARCERPSTKRARSCASSMACSGWAFCVQSVASEKRQKCQAGGKDAAELCLAPSFGAAPRTRGLRILNSNFRIASN